MTTKTFLGYVAQPRRYDGKLDSLATGKTGKVILFGTAGSAYRHIHGDGVVHEKYGPDDDTWQTTYDDDPAYDKD